MDRRNEELLFLKKAYRREKRAATAVWKWLFVLSFAVCAVFAPLAATVFLPELRVGVAAGEVVFLAAGYIPASQSFLELLQRHPNLNLIFLGVGLIVFLVSTVMWICGSRKLRRTDAFLSYRTLRAALREEKKQQA